MKDHCEKISQDYMKKFEDLEIKYDQVSAQNNELQEKNKKLELMARYEGRFGDSNNGIKLDGILMTDANAEQEENQGNQNKDSENYAGFMKINMRATKIIQPINKRPVAMNLNTVNKDLLIRDINMISSDILQKKEQYSKVYY
jgi:hypothetical protein